MIFTVILQDSEENSFVKEKKIFKNHYKFNKIKILNYFSRKKFRFIFLRHFVLSSEETKKNFLGYSISQKASYFLT